jgi:hypothetical protein
MFASNRSQEADNLHARERGSTAVILPFLALECTKDEEVRSFQNTENSFPRSFDEGRRCHLGAADTGSTISSTARCGNSTTLGTRDASSGLGRSV